MRGRVLKGNERAKMWQQNTQEKMSSCLARERSSTNGGMGFLKQQSKKAAFLYREKTDLEADSTREQTRVKAQCLLNKLDGNLVSGLKKHTKQKVSEAGWAAQPQTL